MTNSDVGRNDPCPCGSGAKYKYCCLREERRSTEPRWKDKVDQRITSHFEHGPPVSGDAREETEAFFEAWQLFVDNTDSETRTLATLDDIVDSDKDVDLLLRYALEGAVRAGKQHRSLARRAVDIIDEALEIFEDPAPEWRWLGIRDRTELQLVLGEYDEAEAGARWLTEHVPEQAAGYGLMADVLLERNNPDPDRAVDILERGLEEATHPPSWDLEHRLASARGAQTGGDADDITSEKSAGPSGSDTGGDAPSWSEFWDRYKDSSMDERLELARRQIETDEQFDNEWAFELVANRLWHDAQEHGRMEAWLDLAELTRERHPDAVEPESAVLAARALVSLVMEGRGDERHDWIERLLSDPDTSPENVDRTLEMLAFHGLFGDFTEDLAASLLRFHEQGRTKRSVISWPEWLLTSLAAEWTEDSITQSRGADDLQARLEKLDTEFDIDAIPSRERFVNPVVETFFGPFEESDLIDVIRNDSTEPPSNEERARITALLARWLVDHKDWPATRAWMSISEFYLYWNDPTSRPTDSAPDDPDTQKLQSKLNDEHWMLTDPAGLKGALKAARNRTVLKAPWKSTCLLAANIEVIDLFAAHDLAQNSRVLRSIRYHLDQRFTSITDAITHFAPDDPQVSTMLDDLRERL